MHQDPTPTPTGTGKLASPRKPLMLGVVAAGICAVGSGMVVSPTVTLGSWAGGVVAMALSSTFGRKAMAVVVENATGVGEDLWRGLSSSRPGQFLTTGTSGKVMAHTASIGSFATMLLASHPMAHQGATVPNVLLSVGVASAALVAAGAMEMMQKAQRKMADEGGAQPPSQAKRNRLGM